MSAEITRPIEYGPILAHSVYGQSDGTSPDALFHYTELGELLTPSWFYWRVVVPDARANGIYDNPDNVDDPGDRSAAPSRQQRPSSISLLGEPWWVTEYNSMFTWDEILEGDGWTLHKIGSDGTRHWTRPGKNPREGSSATTGHDGIDKLHVFSSEVPWRLPCDERYSRWAYMVFRDFDGDFSAASQAMRNAFQ